MEKKLFYHPIIVRDNTNGIAFTCTVLNNSEAKIETLEDLKKALLSFRSDYANLNISGAYQGKALLSYYFEMKDGAPEFRFRYFENADNKLVSVAADNFTPDYMSDAVNQIY